MTETCGKLAAAVCAVMVAVKYVRQTGSNQFHRYRYASDEDLLAALQPAMAEAGLALLPIHIDSCTLEHSPDRKGKTQWRTDLVVTYRLVHVSGESIEIQAPGCGLDGEDKGAYKAMTGALKYALRHTFLVPTGDDAEKYAVPAAEPGGFPTAQPNPDLPGHVEPPRPVWTDTQRVDYLKSLSDLKIDAAIVDRYLESKGRTVARNMDATTRGTLVLQLGQTEPRARLAAFVASEK